MTGFFSIFGVRAAALSLSVLLAWSVIGGAADAAPGAKAWPRWRAHDEQSQMVVDHHPWQRFLDTYLIRTPSGTRLRYGAVNTADKAALKTYIAALGAVGVGHLRHDEQFAFWVNLYNAATVDAVLDTYPVASIRDIGSGLFSAGPWKRRTIRVDGVALSLNDIEHRILRPLWGDARVHYTLNCAALGCPDLSPRVYLAAGLSARLDAAARAYINDPRGVEIGASGKLVLSRLYDWYAADFGGNDAAILKHISRYASPALAARLQKHGRVDSYRYDWALNDAATLPDQDGGDRK